MDNLYILGSLLYWVSLVLVLVVVAFYLLGLFSLADFDDWMIDHGKGSVLPTDSMEGMAVWVIWPLFIIWHAVPVLFEWLSKVPE
jgi:hypothetical protein